VKVVHPYSFTHLFSLMLIFKGKNFFLEVKGQKLEIIFNSSVVKKIKFCKKDLYNILYTTIKNNSIFLK